MNGYSHTKHKSVIVVSDMEKFYKIAISQRAFDISVRPHDTNNEQVVFEYWRNSFEADQIKYNYIA